MKERVFITISQMTRKKARLKKASWLVYSHRAGKRQKPDWNTLACLIPRLRDEPGAMLLWGEGNLPRSWSCKLRKKTFQGGLYSLICKWLLLLCPTLAIFYLVTWLRSWNLLSVTQMVDFILSLIHRWLWGKCMSFPYGKRTESSS